jgi:hypothetical protein
MTEPVQLSAVEARQLSRMRRQLIDVISRLKALNSKSFSISIRRHIEDFLNDADRALWQGLVADDVQRAMWEGIIPGGSVATPVVTLSYVEFLQNRTEQVRNVIFRLSVDFEERYYRLDPGRKLNAEADSNRFKKELTNAVSIIIRLQSKIAQLRDRYSFLPGDLPAPIRVAIIENKLVRVSPKQITGGLPANSIAKLRASAAETLKNTIELIQQSNMDKRLAVVLGPLQTQLTNEYEGDFSIEALGDNWRLLQQLKLRMEPDLPAIILALINRCLDSIETILLQFSEWHSYLDSEKLLHVPAEEVDNAIDAAREVAAEFEKHPEVVDGEIVAGLRAIVEPAISGIVSSESVAAPLVASLSNILSALSGLVIESAPALGLVIEKMGAGPRYALIVVALAAMDQCGAQLTKIPALAFVRKAHEYVTTNFPYLKDVLR